MSPIILYKSNISLIISTRYSCRSYKNCDIRQDAKTSLENACAALTRGPFGERSRFHLIDKTDWSDRKVKIGTYGMIVNPRHFLVGTIQNSPMSYVSYGYLLEHLILMATDLGLQTCWLGYFHGKDFVNKFTVPEREIMPAISAVGYASGTKSLWDRVSKKGVWDAFSRYFKKPRQRKPMNQLFFEGDFANPATGKSAGKYLASLEMVRLGPSAGNRQPWRIIKDKTLHTYHLYMSPSHRKGYLEKRLHEIDMGIAMCHFELTARENNLTGTWEIMQQNIETPENIHYIASWVPVTRAR